MNQDQQLREALERNVMVMRAAADKVQDATIANGLYAAAELTETALTATQQAAPYGYCPICGAKGEMRERRMGGNDTCGNGHNYKSSEAVQQAAPSQGAGELISRAIQTLRSGPMSGKERHDVADLLEAAALLEASAQREQPAYRGPTLTPEEVADGNRGIRWVTDTAVFGRPTECDVREYLQKRGDDAKCHCAKCAAFYSQPATSKPEPQAQAGELLQRWGRAPDGSKYLLERMPDGYWTPWHTACEAIAKKDAALKACVEALEQCESVLAGHAYINAQFGFTESIARAATNKGKEALK